MKLLGIKSTYKIHVWTGLISGLLLIIVTASGSVAVFKGEIDRWANPALLTVRPTGPRLSWDRIMEAVRQTCPDAQVLGFSVPSDPTHAVTFNLRRKRPEPPQVFLDPYTGHLLGGRVLRGTLSDYVRQFHVRLLIEGWGRIFVGVLGLVMLASTVTGFIIYAPMNKKSWVPRIRRDRGTRMLLADLHKVVGMAALVFNLMFAATGAVLGLEVLYIRLFPPNAAKPAATPAARAKVAAKPAAEPASPMRAGSIDAALRAAERKLPGTEADRVVLLPRNRLRVYLEHPITDLVKEGVSFAVYDGPRGDVVEVHDGRTAGFWARAYYACEPLHFGQFGGLWVKILYGLAGLTAGFLSITGYVIYAIRQKARRRSPRPPSVRVAQGLAGALVLALVAGPSPSDARAGEVDAKLRDDLANYLAAHHQEPEAYVVGQFRDRDIVFLAEAHVIKESLDFVAGLIPHLHKAGITHLGYEFAHHADQAEIDRIITAETYDEPAARRLLLRFNPLWGYREYVDVFKAAWEVNRHRAPGSPSFRIVALNSDYDWSRLPPGMDPGTTAAKNLIFGGGRHYHDVVNEKWADVITREFLVPGKKALIHCGWGHSSTKFRRDRSPNPAHFSSAGNLVYNAIGDRAAEILLHQPVGYAKDHGPFLDAIHAAVPTLPPALQRGGFDTKGTPFGDLPAASRGYYKGRASGFTMADVHDGYVFLGPPTRFTPVTVIPDFADAANLAEANAQLRVEKGKAYTADEINRMIPGVLMKRFDSQMRP